MKLKRWQVEQAASIRSEQLKEVRLRRERSRSAHGTRRDRSSHRLLGVDRSTEQASGEPTDVGSPECESIALAPDE